MVHQGSGGAGPLTHRLVPHGAKRHAAISLQFLLGIDVLGNESSCDEPQADVEQTGALV